jgi:beta-galactosidase GanA
MKEVKKSSPTLMAYRAEEALRKAVAEAIAEHRRNGIPIAIWRNGKVVRIPAEEIEVREPQIEYGVSRKNRK